MSETRNINDSHAAQVLDRHYKISPDKWYSVSDAARLLLVHRCTIYGLIKKENNPLKGEKKGAHYRFLGSHLIEFRRKYMAEPRSLLYKQAMYLAYASAKA